MYKWIMIAFICIHITYCLSVTTFNIEIGKAGPSLIPEFLSVTIDADEAQHWNDLNFESTLVNTLAKGISPAYFRYGGTAQDETKYDTDGNITSTEYTLNITELSQLVDFAKRNNWKFIFGLNVQERFSNNTWNPANSEQLMNKIIESGKVDSITGYELGNEPDLFHDHSDFMNVTGKQLSKDFVTLYDLIYNKVYKNYKKPLIWGPDTTRNAGSYLQQFLDNSNTNTLSGVTWHQYYGNSKTWNLSDFVSVINMDLLIDQINKTMNIVYESFSKTVPIMLGETSSSYGGGTANLSASFVAGFLWLDKLGLSSAFGLYLVARQDFWGGSYGLIGRYDYEPNADYWSSYLFKNLVGNKVLYVDGEFEKGRSIRVYSYCTKTKDEGSIYDYNKGSVTTMILNAQNNTISVDLKLVGKENEFYDMAGMSYDKYLLTSYPNVVNSRDIYLNGKVLKMVNNKTFPDLKPVQAEFGSTINMEALSYGYVVIVNANVTVCM